MTGMPHLMIDINDVSAEVLIDERAIEKLLYAIPEIINMKIVAGPFVVPFIHRRDDDSPAHFSIDGICIIATSHISIHTLPHTNRMLVDVFSCKAFDQQKVIDLLCASLGVLPGDMEINATQRAMRSPRQEAILA